MQTCALHETCLRREIAPVRTETCAGLPFIKRLSRASARQSEACRTFAALHRHLPHAFIGRSEHSCSSSAVRAVDERTAALIADKSFKCTECGKCCTGAGEVWVSNAECLAIALHLKLPIEDFVQQYCKTFNETYPGWRVLKYKDASDQASKLPSCILWRSNPPFQALSIV